MNKNKSSNKHVHYIYKVMLLLLTLLPLQSFAQSRVTGTVFDESNGEAIIGATVRVKGASTGTVTDVDGHFSIDASAGQTLEVSYIGYTTQTVKVPRNLQVDIRLSEDTHTLDQVVVVGYGTMKRSDLTGSVASINEEQIKQGVNTSIEQAMQGRIAGVQVTQNSGAPGGGISVQIRGINSLNGNEPLYVVDGIAMSGQSSSNTSVLSTINPSDITSIEVLKDASATAIYGSRASNGVVLITTKRGQEGKPKLTYEGYAGWQELPGKLEVMNLKEFAQFYNVRAEIYGYGKREELLDQSLLTNGTDWQEELFDVAFMHNHQVNINGGTNNMHYSISGGFLDQDGVACVLMPLWYMGRFTDYMPDLNQKMAIYQIPVWNEGDVREVLQGGTGTSVIKGTENEQLAKDFLAFAKLSKEGCTYEWNELGFDPVRYPESKRNRADRTGYLRPVFHNLQYSGFHHLRECV